MNPTSGRRPYKLTVRFVSVICALSVMAIYSLSTKTQRHASAVHSSTRSSSLDINGAAASPRLTGRRLFQYSALANSDTIPTDFEDDDDDDDDSDDGDQDNCTAPRSHHAGYNDSCSFVLDQCSGEWVLFDYLRFILCDMKHIQVRRLSEIT